MYTQEDLYMTRGSVACMPKIINTSLYPLRAAAAQPVNYFLGFYKLCRH
jgi:hypothetical protein